jgi:hypothetical protein
VPYGASATSTDRPHVPVASASPGGRAGAAEDVGVFPGFAYGQRARYFLRKERVDRRIGIARSSLIWCWIFILRGDNNDGRDKFRLQIAKRCDAMNRYLNDPILFFFVPALVLIVWVAIDTRRAADILFCLRFYRRFERYKDLPTEGQLEYLRYMAIFAGVGVIITLASRLLQ